MDSQYELGALPPYGKLQNSYRLATESCYSEIAVLMGKSIIPVGKSLKSQCKSIRDLGLN